MKVIFVTGGAGFIGSYFTKFFLRRNKNFIIVNLDKLTYAGKLENLDEIESSPRHHFIKGDICNQDLVNYIIKRYKPDYIINFAAETSIERSLGHSSLFTQSNIIGTLTLMEAARFFWGKNNYAGNRFIQVSTDEVYGNGEKGFEYFMEESNLLPDNPYSASKAGADLMVKAFSNAHGFPAIITRCCSTFGPFQHREKTVPSFIINSLTDTPIQVPNDIANCREWIYVQDHCIGIIRAMFYGKPGEIYNIGTGEAISEYDIARKIAKLSGKPEEFVRQEADRPSQDKHIALNSYKLRNNLNWSNKFNIDDGLRETIQWYKNNRVRWEN